MPIYDFLCLKCNKTREYLAKQDESVLCLDCKGLMEKQLAISNFKFLGDGFYENDYKQKKLKGDY